MRNFEQLTGDNQTVNWTPSESWADMILEASVAYGDLSGKIGATEVAMDAGEGYTCKIRSVPARVAQGPIAHGSGLAHDCLSYASSRPSVYSVTVQKYGDVDCLSGFSFWSARGNLKQAIMTEMSKGLAKKRDQLIWSALITKQGVATTSLGSAMGNKNPLYKNQPKFWRATQSLGSAIWGPAINLYDAIIYSEATMRQTNAVAPDTVIMSPTVAAYLKYMQAAVPGAFNISVDSSNHLLKVGGLTVIETSIASKADLNSGAGRNAGFAAVIIDSKRALAEIWGKRPFFSELYSPKCDQTDVAIWMYYGTGAMDEKAIWHVKNP